MTDFHDKAAARDELQSIFKPVHDTEFDRLLKALDESIAITKKLEAIPIKPKRGIVRWFMR
jgi:hypothetical protein